MPEQATVSPNDSSEEEEQCMEPTAGDKRDHTGKKQRDSSSTTSNTAPTTSRINEQQKKACFEFFYVPGRFNRNSKLPQTGGDQLFDQFLRQQGLLRTQAVTQFKRWQKVRFEFYGEVFDFDKGKILEHLKSKMPSHKDLIGKVIDNMLSNVDNSGKMKIRHPQTEPFYKFIKSQSAKNPFFQILSGVLDGFVDLWAGLVPNKAKLCDDAEDKFYVQRMQMRDRKFDTFYKEIETFDFPEDMRLLEESFNKLTWMVFFLQP